MTSTAPTSSTLDKLVKAIFARRDKMDGYAAESRGIGISGCRSRRWAGYDDDPRHDGKELSEAERERARRRRC